MLFFCLCRCFALYPIYEKPNGWSPRGTTAFHKQENPCFPSWVGRSYSGRWDGRQEQSCLWHLINFVWSLYYVGGEAHLPRGNPDPTSSQDCHQRTMLTALCDSESQRDNLGIPFVSFIRLRSWRLSPRLLTSVRSRARSKVKKINSHRHRGENL